MKEKLAIHPSVFSGNVNILTLNVTQHRGKQNSHSQSKREVNLTSFKEEGKGARDI